MQFWSFFCVCSCSINATIGLVSSYIVIYQNFVSKNKSTYGITEVEKQALEIVKASIKVLHYDFIASLSCLETNSKLIIYAINKETFCHPIWFLEFTDFTSQSLYIYIHNHIIKGSRSST